MAFIASVGKGFAQYIHSWAKAEVNAGMLMRDGSVEMRKPSRVQVWWVWCGDGADIGLVCLYLDKKGMTMSLSTKQASDGRGSDFFGQTCRYWMWKL